MHKYTMDIIIGKSEVNYNVCNNIYSNQDKDKTNYKSKVNTNNKCIYI